MGECGAWIVLVGRIAFVIVVLSAVAIVAPECEVPW